MTSLITGGGGMVGAELAHQLLKCNEKVVVFDKVKSGRLADIADKITFVQGDLGIWPEVFNAVRPNGVTHVYHMGALLTWECEANPWACFQVNVVGSYNVLEAARLSGVKGMMFTSSIGTFDPSLANELSDTAFQRPNSFYGAGKLYIEGLGKSYRRKFGLDFRSLRYPSVVGPENPVPGHWDVPMIQAALAGKPVECPVPPDRGSAMIYYKDAALAAYLLLAAPADRIKTVNYNVGGVRRVTPRELEAALRKHVSGLTVSYVAPPGPPMPVREITWDDSYARSEWGWTPQFSDIDRLVADFVVEMKDPRRHGLAWRRVGGERGTA